MVYMSSTDYLYFYLIQPIQFSTKNKNKKYTASISVNMGHLPIYSVDDLIEQYGSGKGKLHT